MGGRKEREVESETKEMWEKGDGDTGEHKHRENHNQGNQYFIKKHMCLPSLTVSFYRNDGKEVITKRRDVSVSSRDGLSG